MKRNLDIAKSARTIEWLKSEMMSGVSGLFKACFSGDKDELLQAVVDILTSTYVLAKRLGFSYEKVDYEMGRQLELNIREKHEVEQWYGDLSELKDHLKEQQRGSARTPR